jgi:hypothetical protein
LISYKNRRTTAYAASFPEWMTGYIQMGSAVAVGDGSYKNGRGAAGWVIEGTSSVGRIFILAMTSMIQVLWD